MAKEIVLSKSKDQEIVIVASNQEFNIMLEKVIEIKDEKTDFIELNNKDRIDKEQVQCCCHIKEMDETTAKEYIKATDIDKSIFPCYAGHNPNNIHHNLIVHQGALSSFKCAVDILGQPEYIIIYRRENKIKQYPLTPEECYVSTNSNNHT